MEAHFSNESDYNFDDSSSNSNTHQLHPRKKKKKKNNYKISSTASSIWTLCCDNIYLVQILKWLLRVDGLCWQSLHQSRIIKFGVVSWSWSIFAGLLNLINVCHTKWWIPATWTIMSIETFDRQQFKNILFLADTYVVMSLKVSSARALPDRLWIP